MYITSSRRRLVRAAKAPRVKRRLESRESATRTTPAMLRPVTDNQREAYSSTRADPTRTHQAEVKRPMRLIRALLVATFVVAIAGQFSVPAASAASTSASIGAGLRGPSGLDAS